MKKTFRLLLFIIACATFVSAQTTQDENNAQDPAPLAVKQLASRDPVVRQRAAEELAKLEATDQRRLIEGYRLQEKNSRVKLALDWALYRTGKREALFAIVGALDSSRSEQATTYLNTLENPEPLYLFLERMNGNTQIKLLDVLAKIGNADTLERIKSYAESYDPKVAEAAQRAAHEIEQRQGEPPADQSTRPRQVGEKETSP